VIFSHESSLCGLIPLISVAIVHLVKMNPNPIPPPVDDNVIKGYNPVLDLPKPSTLENYLHKYDVVFLVDDSGSVATSSASNNYTC